MHIHIVLFIIWSYCVEVTMGRHLQERNYGDRKSLLLLESVYRTADAVRQLDGETDKFHKRLKIIANDAFDGTADMGIIIDGIQKGGGISVPISVETNPLKTEYRRALSDSDNNQEDGQSGISSLQETLSNFQEHAMQHLPIQLPTPPPPPPPPPFHPNSNVHKPDQRYPFRICLKRERLPSNYIRGRARSRLCRLLRRRIKRNNYFDSNTDNSRRFHLSFSKTFRKLGNNAKSNKDRRNNGRHNWFGRNTYRTHPIVNQEGMNDVIPMPHQINNQNDPLADPAIPNAQDNVMNVPYDTDTFNAAQASILEPNAQDNTKNGSNYTGSSENRILANNSSISISEIDYKTVPGMNVTDINESWINVTADAVVTSNDTMEFAIEIVGNTTYNDTGESMYTHTIMAAFADIHCSLCRQLDDLGCIRRFCLNDKSDPPSSSNQQSNGILASPVNIRKRITTIKGSAKDNAARTEPIDNTNDIQTTTTTDTTGPISNSNRNSNTRTYQKTVKIKAADPASSPKMNTANNTLNTTP